MSSTQWVEDMRRAPGVLRGYFQLLMRLVGVNESAMNILNVIFLYNTVLLQGHPSFIPLVMTATHRTNNAVILTEIANEPDLGRIPLLSLPLRR